MYVNLVLRCVLFYFLLIFALRFMGKREVGELSVFDIVIYLVMSELLALALTETEESIFKAIIPIFTLVILQITVSIFILKNKKFRDIIDGKPVILIQDGILSQKEMKKQRYNIDDLLFQLRSKDISDLKDIKFAILENNGSLSVLKKQDCELMYPEPIIQDGQVNKNVLKSIHKDETWLKKELYRHGFESSKQIFLALYMKNSIFFLKK